MLCLPKGSNVVWVPMRSEQWFAKNSQTIHSKTLYHRCRFQAAANRHLCCWKNILIQPKFLMTCPPKALPKLVIPPQLLFTQPSIFKRSFRSICAACHAPPGQTKQQRRVTSDVPMVPKWYTYQTMHLEWCHEPPRHFTFYDTFSSLKLCSAAIFIKDLFDVQMTATN